MKEYNAKRLYTNIHKLCRTNNVNIGDLEREIGFRLGYFSRVYHGAAAPRCDCLIKVCNKFNITMDSLLFDEIKTYKEKIYENQLEQLNEFYKCADTELKEALNYTIDDIQKKIRERKIMMFHLLFEQSGTFKKELNKLGYQAKDYDILNDFGETDYQIDLFNEIETAYVGGGKYI